MVRSVPVMKLRYGLRFPDRSGIQNRLGATLGLVGIGAVILSSVVTHYTSWIYSRVCSISEVHPR